MKKLMIAATALALMSGAAFAQSNTAAQQGDKTQMNAGASAAFCLEVRGAQSCKFATLADCQKEAKGNGTCAANPKSGQTTGAASGAASTTSPAASNPGTDKAGSNTMNKSSTPEKGK